MSKSERNPFSFHVLLSDAGDNLKNKATTSNLDCKTNSGVKLEKSYDVNLENKALTLTWADIFLPQGSAI